MTFVFVFVGEFGYELLNWQGVVRKARASLPDARIVCASRGGVAPLYEGAEYVDIGHVEPFRQSVASGYWALSAVDTPAGATRHERRLSRAVERAIRRAVPGLGSRLSRGRARFVFSSRRTELAGCLFGCDPTRWGHGEGDIYAELDLANNEYARIQPVLSRRETLERRLEMPLQDFVLVQGRRRDAVVRSEVRLPERRILQALGRRLPVVLIDFSTGRRDDSYSLLPDVPGARRIAVDGLPEQSCLIHHARRCVFLSEGDFGSHIYVPPFMGRDVVAVAPREVYGLGTTPIDFWNRHVFRFGGSILPVVAEDIESDDALEGWADAVARPVPR